jgi:beta-lactamase class A
VTTPDLAALFADAGVDGFFHAVDLGNGNEVSHQADAYVVPASVFKLPVLLELFRQAEAGEIDATTPVVVPVENRAPGPNGLSVMCDPMTASLRDLAWLMMGISDNAATDVICEKVGLDNVNATLISLGIKETTIADDCRTLFASMYADLGVTSLDEIPLPVTRELLDKLSSHDPLRASPRTTPRDIAALLGLIWNDEAAPAAACAEVRRILGLQVWPHRLASGFADLDEVRTSGKTGTLTGIRNEAGVVEYPDGGRYVVTCFTRAESLTLKHAKADAVIGASARLAVDHLRSIA